MNRRAYKIIHDWNLGKHNNMTNCDDCSRAIFDVMQVFGIEQKKKEAA